MKCSKLFIFMQSCCADVLSIGPIHIASDPIIITVVKYLAIL